jgi:hypothetical protein
MDRHLALPVAQAKDSRFMTDERGAPVWPYANSSEKQLLIDIARLFGRQTVEVTPISVTPRDTGTRLVAGYGNDVEMIGRLYAHLTQRRYLHVGAPAAAVSDDSTDVVLCIDRAAPHELLDEIARKGKNACLGIIWTTDADSLLRQALIRAAASVLDPAPSARSLVLSPTAGVTEGARIGALELRGELLDPDELGSSAVLMVTTHSDGIDAMLGQRLTLCSLVDLDLNSVDATPRPKCIITGECHRQAMPIAAALASDRLVSARRLAGRVLIWNTCFGIMGRYSTVTEAWGLLPHLVASANVGCLVVLRGIVNTGSTQVLPLVATLQDGMSVGEALATWQETLNVLPHSMLRDRIFLFGDPAVVANRAVGDGDMHDVRAAIPVDQAPAPWIASSEGPVLRRFLEDVKVWQPDLSSRVEECRRAVDAYELECSSATTLRTYAERSTELQQTLLGVLTRMMWSSWLDSWMRIATIREKLSDGRCHDCGGVTWAARYDLRPPGSAPRYYSNCASCGAIDDCPEDCEAVVVSEEHGLRLLRGGPRSDWAGALLSAPVGRDLVWREWPRDENDLPQSECLLTETLQIGPIFRLAIFIQDWRVSIFMRRTFIEAVGSR